LANSTPIRLLKTFIRNGTLPHALLFSGDDGVGKKMNGHGIGHGLQLPDVKIGIRHHRPHLDAIDACGDCGPCRKISGNHHPDIIRVAPLSSVIRIAQIRTLLQTLALKPNEADRRVVILSEAQTMNPEAGNALLKVLEEPPDRTLLVLTARQTSTCCPRSSHGASTSGFPPFAGRYQTTVDCGRRRLNRKPPRRLPSLRRQFHPCATIDRQPMAEPAGLDHPGHGRQMASDGPPTFGPGWHGLRDWPKKRILLKNRWKSLQCGCGTCWWSNMTRSGF
jgi:hypothetical protein